MLKITPKTKVYIIIFLLVIITVALFYFYKNPVPQQVNAYKCPEDYTEDDIGTEEYKNALIDWTSSYFEANPKATMSDWSIAKSKLWMDNNCVVAIERSKISGEFADLKPWERVDYEIQNTLDNAINSTN